MTEPRNIALLAVATAAMLAQSPSPAGGSRASLTGYVGCSTTTQAVHGYALEGGNRLWRPASWFDGKGALGAYAGGSPRMWQTWPSLYWPDFQTMADRRPNVSGVWFQVCMAQDDDVASSLAYALATIEQIHERLPGAVIWLSPMTGYVNPPQKVGDGPERSALVVEQLVELGAGLAGPTLPRLDDDDLLEDGIHENEQGMRRMGRALFEFFGTSAVLREAFFWRKG